MHFSRITIHADLTYDNLPIDDLYRSKELFKNIQDPDDTPHKEPWAKVEQPTANSFILILSWDENFIWYQKNRLYGNLIKYSVSTTVPYMPVLTSSLFSRLTEIGPRMTLKLFKIEEGICDGPVLYHKYIHKTEEEKKAILRKRQDKRYGVNFYPTRNKKGLVDH